MFVIKIISVLTMHAFKEFNVVLINKDPQITSASVLKDSQILVVCVQDALKAPFGVLQPVDVFLFVDKILHILQLAKLASVIQALDF